MKCYIGVGSNLGDRLDNLERAARAVTALCGEVRASAVYETGAMVPDGASEDWRIPFLNGVIECEWYGSAPQLLLELKQIELKLGRGPAARWAPRVLDLDILLLGNQRIETEGLTIPHPGIESRAFVLDPLAELNPDFRARARACRGRSPQWMGILNVTPDSFSDGGECAAEGLAARLGAMDGAQMIDIGAESTRPGARPLTSAEEWERLAPALKSVNEYWRGKIFRPRISVDTRHAWTAERALEFGADIINDVSGGDALLRSADCDYVLMHSLSIPADPKQVLPAGCDPVRTVIEWGLRRIDELAIDSKRIIFDPGVGFGKTAGHSLEIIRRIDEILAALPVRVLVGHSRKSFLKQFTNRPPAERDFESIGVSLQLAARGVDILRVHEPIKHMRAQRAFKEAERGMFTSTSAQNQNLPAR